MVSLIFPKHIEETNKRFFYSNVMGGKKLSPVSLRDMESESGIAAFWGREKVRLYPTQSNKNTCICNPAKILWQV